MTANELLKYCILKLEKEFLVKNQKFEEAAKLRDEQRAIESREDFPTFEELLKIKETL